MIDLAELKTETTDDPTGLGLALHVASGSTSELEKILNEKMASIQVDNFVSAFDIEEAVDPADWPTGGNEQWKRDLWRDILLSIGPEGSINANATNLKAKVLMVFASGTPTRTALAALRTRDGSRVEQLWGLNEYAPHGMIAEALALP